jgi:Flp pilus assembly protein protease CpaA
MQTPFFPGPLFAWVFLGVLLSLLAAASYTDLGRMVVPKRVTLTALALGVIFNILRGALLGAQGIATWKLVEGSTWLGACDGALFALAGFALGFVLFFLMWIFGVCGGGDVKLFAALGAWIGPYLAICVLAMSLVIIVGFVFARLTLNLLRGRRTVNRGPWTKTAVTLHGPRSTVHGPRSTKLQPRRRILGFSLPLAIATALVLFWSFRVDLQFVTAQAVAARGLPSHAN